MPIRHRLVILLVSALAGAHPVGAAPADAPPAGEATSLPAPPSALKIVPRLDPVDGIVWRGDQFHAVSEEPAVDGRFERDGVYRFRDLRWGFLPSKEIPGAWIARFERAVIRVDSAVRLVYLLNPFGANKFASHAALLLEFEDPAAITNPDTGETSRGLVLSVEGRIRNGETYSLWQGLLFRYPLVHVLSTWEDYQQDILQVYGGRIERYVLRVTPEEARRVARAALETSLTDHRRSVYHLTRASCVTGMIDILNQGLDPEKRFLRKFLWGALVRPSLSIPTSFPRLLERSGLLEERLDDLSPETAGGM